MRASVVLGRAISQGVFMRSASAAAINRSGPVHSHGQRKKFTPMKDRYFVVGRDQVGDDKMVGAPE